MVQTRAEDDDLTQRLAEVFDAFAQVRLAYLFGSAARGALRPRSDLDIAVLTRGPLGIDQEAEMLARLEQTGGARVDLIDLSKAPPLLVREVLDGGLVLVCRDEMERAHFEMRARARYLDSQHLRRVQHHYLRERIEARRARQS